MPNYMDYEISSQQAHMRGSVWGVQPGFSLSLFPSFPLSLHLWELPTPMVKSSARKFSVLILSVYSFELPCVRRNESDRKLKQIWNDVIYYNDKMIKQEIFD